MKSAATALSFARLGLRAQPLEGPHAHQGCLTAADLAKKENLHDEWFDLQAVTRIFESAAP
jgi:hypothetical protein